MATFVFTGDYDKVSAELKKALEARDASFNASLQALFKPKSPSLTPSVRATAPNARPTEKPAARTTGPHTSAVGSSNSTLSRSSKGEDADTVRGRLRTSIRPR